MEAVGVVFFVRMLVLASPASQFLFASNPLLEVPRDVGIALHTVAPHVVERDLLVGAVLPDGDVQHEQVRVIFVRLHPLFEGGFLILAGIEIHVRFLPICTLPSSHTSLYYLTKAFPYPHSSFRPS